MIAFTQSYRLLSLVNIKSRVLRVLKFLPVWLGVCHAMEMETRIEEGKITEGSPVRLSRKKQAAFTLVVFIVFLLLVESLLWIFGIPRRLRNDPGWARKAKNAIGFEHTPNWSGYHAGAITTINSSEWRGKEFSPSKTEGIIRILGVGDSFTFGRAVGDDEVFLVRLEEILNSESDKQYETINSGHERMNTLQELQYMKDRNMMALKPDAVILGFTIHNDAQISDSGYRRVLRRKMRERSLLLRTVESNGYKRVAKYSRITRILDDGARWAKVDLITELSSSTILANYKEDSKGWETCRNSLLGIYDLCREANVPLIVALFPIFKSDTGRTFADYPDDFRKVHHQLKTVLDDKPGVTVIDILDDLAASGIETNQLKVPKDGHPNALWHDIVARRLRLAIKELRL